MNNKKIHKSFDPYTSKLWWTVEYFGENVHINDCVFHGNEIIYNSDGFIACTQRWKNDKKHGVLIKFYYEKHNK